jgi:tRNA A37 threonylcarbamoyladenosine biosynthesis protein TsaE
MSKKGLWTRMFQTMTSKTTTMNSTKVISTPASANKKPYTVVVEGNIGSGKTTFLAPFLKYEGIFVNKTENSFIH